MNKRRPPNPNDQVDTEHAYRLILDLILSRPEIEPAIWTSALLSVFADSFIGSDFSYEDYKESMEMAIVHYKSWWDKDDN